MNGSVGWLLMEIVSPIAFFLSLPLGQSSSLTISTSPSYYLDYIRSLPLARQILVLFFLVHYLNRSIISTFVNPSRARMNLLVPISAVVFNVMNGSTMGMWVGGGCTRQSCKGDGFGLEDGILFRVLFGMGAILWIAGLSSNIYHDHILYDLKRDKMMQQLSSKTTTSQDPKTRYSIPSAGLYAYISHPSYSSEWFEWLGYLLCTLSLTSSPFPPTPLDFNSSSLTSIYSPLVPLEGWWLQPPALFLWQEIGVMLPRARAGHKWYEKTFGEEWEKKGAKWVVIPGVY